MLGPMPTEHVVSMLNASPPARAAQALLSMPKDRVNRLLAVMDGQLIARMIVGADPARRATLLGYVDDERLATELAKLPMTESAAVYGVLPPDRLKTHLARVPSEELATMLLEMNPDHRRGVVESLDAERLVDLRRVAFEKKVIESLQRTAANLSWVPEDPGSNLFAGAFNRIFGISLCYVDDDDLQAEAVAVAQRTFAHALVHGLLVITNAAPTQEAITLVTRPNPIGPPSLVVTWDPDENDGILARALVRLAG